MKFSLKQIIAGSLLAVAASSSAFAFDAANLPADGGNGSLIVVAFDADAGKSVAVDLGLNYLDVLNNASARDGRVGSDITPDAGKTLSFSVDLSVFGGNLANVQWNVISADAFGPATSTQALVTGQLGQPFPSITNGNIASVIGGLGFANIVAQCNSNGQPTLCVGADALSSTYFGGATWGSNMQYLNPSVSASLGTAMGFYELNRSSATAGGTPVTNAYANSAGVAAQWLLDSTGALTYTSAQVSSVPVPAAIWLLLSGLSGLGLIGRRRSAV